MHTMTNDKHTGALTLAAVAAFAANSILTRAALGANAIDAASFSTLRLLAGGIALLCVHAMRGGSRVSLQGNFKGAFMLTLYAVPFSFAYKSLRRVVEFTFTRVSLCDLREV